MCIEFQVPFKGNSKSAKGPRGAHAEEQRRVQSEKMRRHWSPPPGVKVDNYSFVWCYFISIFISELFSIFFSNHVENAHLIFIKFVIIWIRIWTSIVIVCDCKVDFLFCHVNFSVFVFHFHFKCIIPFSDLFGVFSCFREVWGLKMNLNCIYIFKRYEWNSSIFQLLENKKRCLFL